jgi:hypothetical protein
MPPLLILGAIALGALVLRKKNPAAAKSTVDAMIDPTELYSPNVALVRWQMSQAIATNDPTLIRSAADVISTALKMPKTGANLRTWADMVPGGKVSGEIGAAFARERPGSDRKPIVIPDWLRFQATQSLLAGDPAHIRATAETMKRFGYRRAAQIHLAQL